MSPLKKMGAHRPHKRHAMVFEGPGRTKQSFKKECDINEILKQFTKTGLITHVKKHHGFYDDFTSASDYHSALNQIADAQAMFLTLPAQLRAQFDNDPAKFLDFVHDPDNEDEMREMGLLEKKQIQQKEAPQKAEKASKDGGGPEVQPPHETPSDTPSE